VAALFVSSKHIRKISILILTPLLDGFAVFKQQLQGVTRRLAVEVCSDNDSSVRLLKFRKLFGHDAYLVVLDSLVYRVPKDVCVTD
jgi:hypothetical protein